MNHLSHEGGGVALKVREPVVEYYAVASSIRGQERVYG